MEATNYYDEKNKRKLLGNVKQKSEEETNPYEDKRTKLKEAAKDVGGDLLFGLLGGGLFAATLGKYAFLAGLGISGYGHYSENKKLTALGLGLMASGTMNALNGKPIDPKLSQGEQIAERIKAFGNELKQKLFLDKLMLGDKSESVNGIEKNNENNPVLKTVTEKMPPAEAFLALERLNLLDKQVNDLNEAEENNTSYSKKQEELEELDEWDIRDKNY